jgi:hypothetical protein
MQGHVALERGDGWGEPLAEPRRRRMRAALVAAVWAVSALPVALGWQRCAVATLFHRPCPGCGMTRAIHLMQHGEIAASLRMQPLALPALVVGGLLMASTVWTTLALGSPFVIHKSRFGRVAIACAAVVYTLAFVLWGLRWFGWFGGPVPVL